MFRKTWKKFIEYGEKVQQRNSTMMLSADILPLSKVGAYPRIEKESESNGNEGDPTGRSPHQPGAKLDAGKTCVFRGAIGYFPRAINAVAEVSTFGASKYTWRGWESVPDGVNRYSDALGRHLLREGTGEQSDPDSGLLHAAHSAWNALARLELMLKEREDAS